LAHAQRIVRRPGLGPAHAAGPEGKNMPSRSSAAEKRAAAAS
jgi:hypothetical protein